MIPALTFIAVWSVYNVPWFILMARQHRIEESRRRVDPFPTEWDNPWFAVGSVLWLFLALGITQAVYAAGRTG